MDGFFVIVEGKNDAKRLRKFLPENIPIAMTYGIPGQDRLTRLRWMARHRQVVVVTDADAAGRRIRRMLKDVFPDAWDIYTKPGFNGVEHTPTEYMEDRFRRLGILADPEAAEDYSSKG
ncbi:toprim domain-containing protein [Sulfobacillus harzensis]|uniref:Topoisomerase n=1 Tax=Sulfobacillus harzensis TaxID=2729629 RepID=A0A7Y0L5V4_9FIRM|nr:topoisomerase [Sulfobacillus harzensis]